MWRAPWNGSARPPQTERPAASLRDRLAKLLALATVLCLGVAFILSKGTQLLMPGPLTSAHGAIENCTACHAKSGSSKLSWVHGLLPGDRLADSKACLGCHKMPETAFNAHGASGEVLLKSAKRLSKIAGNIPQPISARAQSVAFPTHDMVTRGLACATCHQEHQGTNFKLNKISNEQCRSCHVVQFDSFDGNHPKFDGYPFKRRTPIVYDHAAHFGKHFPEVAKKDPAKRIPASCSACHNSRDDKRIMAVAPFEQTCSACHLDQITGKERASGPKGIAFLTLPGLDLQSLKEKKAAIGEWPEDSEAALTPFMKVMISRNEQGRALIKTVDGLNLQDLASASDVQIKAVTDLVWEIKALLQAMILGKASDVLGDLNLGGGVKLSADLVADLTASIPRDVLISAQQQWLPNLATEMANRSGTSEQQQKGWAAVKTETNSDGSEPHEAVSGGDSDGRAAEPEKAAAKTEPETPKTDNDDEAPSSEGADSAADTSDSTDEASRKDARQADQLDPPACLVRVLGQCLVPKVQESDATSAKADSGKDTSSPDKLPPAMRAGLSGLAPVARAAGDGKATPVADKQPEAKAANQSDDLLSPNEEELREIKAHNKNFKSSVEPGVSAAGPNAPTGAPTNAAASPQPRAAPVVSIESDVDPESWAEYGGWYRQDYAILYRPTGHKDKFIYSWLFLTGPRAPKGDASPMAAVFDFLTSKDAQGSCTKCHSVDDIKGKGRLVNFSQPSAETKRGSFTTFVHEPHFSTLGNRGCLTCHNLEKGRPYLKSYEQGNPHVFASNFGGVKKELCQTCHQSNMARQDCLECHKYHVNGVIAPIMNTKIPMQ